MAKAIILTGIELDSDTKEKLINTKIFKLALNHHCQDMKANLRIITDYGNFDYCSKLPEILVTVRYKPRFNEDKYIVPNIQYRGSTIVAGIEYLYQQGFDEILLVGDNSVHGADFRKCVNENIKTIRELYGDLKLYQFTTGYFELPVLSVKDFLKRKNVITAKTLMEKVGVSLPTIKKYLCRAEFSHIEVLYDQFSNVSEVDIKRLQKLCRKMSKEDVLLENMKELNKMYSDDKEALHIRMDELLLAFIGDIRIEVEFYKNEKYYS